MIEISYSGKDGADSREGDSSAATQIVLLWPTSARVPHIQLSVEQSSDRLYDAQLTQLPLCPLAVDGEPPKRWGCIPAPSRSYLNIPESSSMIRSWTKAAILDIQKQKLPKVGTMDRTVWSLSNNRWIDLKYTDFNFTSDFF